MSTSEGNSPPVYDRTARTPKGTVIPDHIVDLRIIALIRELPWAPDVRDFLTYGKNLHMLTKEQVGLILEGMTHDGILRREWTHHRRESQKLSCRWVYFLEKESPRA